MTTPLRPGTIVTIAPVAQIALGGSWLDDQSLGSRFNTEWALLNNLKTRGRAAAAEWMGSCFGEVGVRSSVDLQARFG